MSQQDTDRFTMDDWARELALCLAGVEGRPTSFSAAVIRKKISKSSSTPEKFKEHFHAHLAALKNSLDKALENGDGDKETLERIQQRTQFLFEMLRFDRTMLDIFIDLFHLYDLSKKHQDANRIANATESFKSLSSSSNQSIFYTKLAQQWGVSENSYLREDSITSIPVTERFNRLVKLRRSQANDDRYRALRHWVSELTRKLLNADNPSSKSANALRDLAEDQQLDEAVFYEELRQQVQSYTEDLISKSADGQIPNSAHANRRLIMSQSLSTILEKRPALIRPIIDLVDFEENGTSRPPEANAVFHKNTDQTAQQAFLDYLTWRWNLASQLTLRKVSYPVESRPAEYLFLVRMREQQIARKPPQLPPAAPQPLPRQLPPHEPGIEPS